MLGVGLNDAAGRTAYLARFHAAQTLIFERHGKVLKTHHGVHTEFLRLTKDDPRLDEDMRSFLSAPTISRRWPITKPAPAPKSQRNERQRRSPTGNDL